MMPVVAQVSKGIQDTSAVFLVGMPQVCDGLAGGGGLLHIVKAHIDAGGIDRVILQKLRVQGYPVGGRMGEVQRNRGIVVIPHRMTGINQVVQGYLDPIPGIGPEDQGLISATCQIR